MLPNRNGASRDGQFAHPMRGMTWEIDVNRDRLEGIWKQFSGKVREECCRLTGDATGMVAARRDQLIGWNQEGRGISQEAVEHQLKEFQVRNRDWDLTNR